MESVDSSAWIINRPTFESDAIKIDFSLPKELIELREYLEDKIDFQGVMPNFEIVKILAKNTSN